MLLLLLSSSWDMGEDGSVRSEWIVGGERIGGGIDERAVVGEIDVSVYVPADD
jgi:hypothetical protein